MDEYENVKGLILEACASGKATRIEINFEGVLIPIKFYPAPASSKAVIFYFHGSIKRDLREIPAFASTFKELSHLAHQISISDSTMLTEGEFNCSWYAGSDRVPLQAILVKVIKIISEVLNADKRIYLGNSGGGFASLYFSYHDKGSICFAVNPQTVIENHGVKKVMPYLKKCWPKLKNISELNRFIVSDVTRLYMDSPANSVILIKNSTDHAHTFKHVQPLLSAYAQIKNRSFLLYSDFWGKVGHAQPPKQVILNWLYSALDFKAISVNDIAQNYSNIMSLNKEDNRKPSHEVGKLFDDIDMKLADEISAWELS